MKTKEELKAAAKATLKNYPHSKEVFATLDGNIFLEKNRAELHAKKETIISFTKADFAKAAIKKASGTSKADAAKAAKAEEVAKTETKAAADAKLEKK